MEESYVSASSSWQNRFYKKISAKIGLPYEEFEEIKILKQAADALRNFRNKLLTEKCD